MTEVIISSILLQLLLLLMHRAAILDFEVVGGEVLLTFGVGNETSEGL